MTAVALRESSPLPASDAERAARLTGMFDAHYDAVWRTLRRLGVTDADDAAQRVFVIAARKLDAIEVGREAAYLFGVAAKIASEIRRRTPERHEVHDERVLAALADDASGPEEALLAHEAREALDVTLDGMPDDLRLVLVLVELEGLSLPELADTLGVPLGTATSRLRRAREAFTKSARRTRSRLAPGGTGQ